MYKLFSLHDVKELAKECLIRNTSNNLSGTLQIGNGIYKWIIRSYEFFCTFKIKSMGY